LGFDLEPPVELERLLLEVPKDKKSADGVLHIVLPVGIGDCTVRPYTPAEFAALFGR
jgi:3-dehydroquinate synthase